MTKKITILLLALIMVFSFTACNKRTAVDESGSGVNFLTGLAVYDLSNPGDVVVDVEIGGGFAAAQINSAAIPKNQVSYSDKKLTIKKSFFTNYKNKSERVLNVQNKLGETASIDIMIATKLIKTAEDFQSINSAGNLEGYYVLANDIDFPDDFNFTMIGCISGDEYDENLNPFNGIFEGAGHKLSNIKINRDFGDVPGSFVAGIFRTVAMAGVVRNLAVENVTVTAHGIAGAIAGLNKGTIKNCFVGASVTARAFNEPCGAFVGFNTDTGVIENCISDSAVDGFAFAGGNYNLIKNSFAAVKQGSNLPVIGGYYRVGSEAAFPEGFKVDNQFALNMQIGYLNNCKILSDTELKNKLNFENFDSNIWNIKDGSIPALRIKI